MTGVSGRIQVGEALRGEILTLQGFLTTGSVWWILARAGRNSLGPPMRGIQTSPVPLPSGYKIHFNIESMLNQR